MNNKIVFLDSSTLGETPNIHLLKQYGEYKSYPYTKKEQTIERLKDSNIVITNKVVIDKSVIDKCRTLRLICIAATGMNNIDLQYAAQKNIVVKNVAGYSTESVAQSTFAMLFYLIHRLSYYDQYVKSGEYCISPIFTHHPYPFFELKGKKFGIIGLGTIGSRVAHIANAFGAEVVYFSTSGKNNSAEYKMLSLTDLLSTSDIISIHCPLNDKTLNLIGLEEFKLMKPSAYILNMGRGGIINENALAEATDNQQIAGAALDVLTSEPILRSNPLMNVKYPEKLLITPHTAWTSMEARSLLVEKIAENIKNFVESNENTAPIS